MQVMRIADEKVNLAHQIYDFVDKHICSLDKELRNFDGELGQERVRLGLPVNKSPLAICIGDTGTSRVNSRINEKGCGCLCVSSEESARPTSSDAITTRRRAM